MNPPCPRCGRELIERKDYSTGTWFLGCILSPSCAGWLPLEVQPVVAETWHAEIPGKRAGPIATGIFLLESTRGEPLSDATRQRITVGIVAAVLVLVALAMLLGSTDMFSLGGTFTNK